MIIIGGFHKLINWEKKYNTIVVNNYFIVKAYDISRSLLVNKKKRKKKLVIQTTSTTMPIAKLHLSR